MAEGKDKYEERMRLRSENDLLRERNENARLKADAVSFELQAVISAAVVAFFKGDAGFEIAHNEFGKHSVTFRPPSRKES